MDVLPGARLSQAWTFKRESYRTDLARHAALHKCSWWRRSVVNPWLNGLFVKTVYTWVMNGQNETATEREHLLVDCWCGHSQNDHGSSKQTLLEARSRLDAGLPAMFEIKCHICDNEQVKAGTT